MAYLEPQIDKVFESVYPERQDGAVRQMIVNCINSREINRSNKQFHAGISYGNYSGGTVESAE